MPSSFQSTPRTFTRRVLSKGFVFPRVAARYHGKSLEVGMPSSEFESLSLPLSSNDLDSGGYRGPRDIGYGARQKRVYIVVLSVHVYVTLSN